MKARTIGLALLACAAGLLSPAVSAETEVMFFFDAEDYVNDASKDALRELCDLFREESATAHVAIVGHLLDEIDRQGRTDVIRSLAPHVIGTQTMYHSRHPNVLEAADDADYGAAYRRVRAEEEEGLRIIRRVMGRDALFAVPPGESKSHVAMDVYADLGVRFFCDTVCTDGRGGDIHCSNLRHFAYSTYPGGFAMESLIPQPDGGQEEIDWADVLDRIAAHPRQLLYLHPCRAYFEDFWDAVNFNRGNLVPFGKWKPCTRRPEADTRLYYARLRELIRRLRADRRFTFPTLVEKAAAEKPRQDITHDDLPFLAAHMRTRIDMTADPSWSVADVFQAALRFLRGETRHAPGKVRGFLSKPYAVSEPVTLKAADLKAAAATIDLDGFLPSELTVGGVRIGPGDFLRAALEVLATGADAATVAPADPLAALDRFPPLRDFRPAGTWIYWPQFKDAYTSDRLRWQLWTMRYEPTKATPLAECWRMFDRRVGMFVHWGIYAADGWHEQQRMRLGIGRAEYEKRAVSFTAERFDADKFVSAAKSLGADYIVFTSKHHDGFCMWDTKTTDFKVTNTPCGRDVLKELAEACKREGVKLGLYYSNPDWHHPNAYNALSSHQTLPEKGDVPDMDKYRAYVRAQVTELLTNYGEIVCFFWDIPTKIEDPGMNALVRRLQPNIKINDRGWGAKGDYSTPEREVPEGSLFPCPTEACDSVGADSWGYRANEDYRTVGYLTRSIDAILSMGGNYLLNVGPKADGTIPAESLDLLAKAGAWYGRVRESYRDVETVTNLVSDASCFTTVRGKTVYLHYPKGLTRRGLDLSPMTRLPKSATLLNTGKALAYEVVPMPRSVERLKRPCLHVTGIPADELANESVVVRLVFDGDEPGF